VSYLPQDYYEYYPTEYQPQFWQAVFSGLVNIGHYHWSERLLRARRWSFRYESGVNSNGW